MGFASSLVIVSYLVGFTSGFNTEHSPLCYIPVVNTYIQTHGYKHIYIDKHIHVNTHTHIQSRQSGPVVKHIHVHCIQQLWASAYLLPVANSQTLKVAAHSRTHVHIHTHTNTQMHIHKHAESTHTSTLDQQICGFVSTGRVRVEKCPTSQ